MISAIIPQLAPILLAQNETVFPIRLVFRQNHTPRTACISLLWIVWYFLISSNAVDILAISWQRDPPLRSCRCCRKCSSLSVYKSAMFLIRITCVGLSLPKESKLNKFFLPRPPLIRANGGAVMREFSCVSLDWVRIPASTQYIRGSSLLLVLALVLRQFSSYLLK